MNEMDMDPFWRKCLQSLGRPGASELVANRPDSFFVTYKGVKERIPAPRMSLATYIKLIKENVVPLVRSEQPFDETQGYIFEGHYRVPGAGGYEGRCHIALNPIAEIPRVTLTKIADSSNSIESIAASGSMSTEMMQFLIAAVRAKLTIVISGQSGAGKTTTLQALTKYFTDQDSIGVAEDVPELTLMQSNSFYLHTMPWKPGLDPNLVADLSFVVKQFLRQRPDRIIIGETRGKEFADFLVATNSGMNGSLTTIHANDPLSALDKMTRFALQGSERQPIRSINKEIGTAVDLILQLDRIDGKHRVTHIQEITDTVGVADDAKLSSATLYEYDGIADNWIKKNMMTDRLQKRMISRGANLKPFLATGTNTILQKHVSANHTQPADVNQGGEFNNSGNPFSGLGRAI